MKFAQDYLKLDAKAKIMFPVIGAILYLVEVIGLHNSNNWLFFISTIKLLHSLGFYYIDIEKLYTDKVREYMWLVVRYEIELTDYEIAENLTYLHSLNLDLRNDRNLDLAEKVMKGATIIL